MNKNVSENDDVLMTIAIFSEKNKENIRVSEFVGLGRNKAFWPEYLPIRVLILEIRVFEEFPHLHGI